MIDRETFTFWLVMIFGIDLLFITAIAYLMDKKIKLFHFARGEVKGEEFLVITDAEASGEFNIDADLKNLSLAQIIAKAMEKKFNEDQQDTTGKAYASREGIPAFASEDHQGNAALDGGVSRDHISYDMGI